MSVLLETTYGDIVIDLYDKLAAKTALNFLKLCKIKYYNDCQFFHIEKGFVARTGDPRNDGTGGESVFAKTQGPGHELFAPGFTFLLNHRRKGTVSMTTASSHLPGTNMLGSQFFITLSDDLTYLDGKHTPVGFVAEGINVLDRLSEAYVDEHSKPYRPIRVRHTIVLHDPFEDPKGMPDACPSPEPIQDGAESLGSDEEDTGSEVEDFVKLRRIEEKEAEQEAKSRAEVLEMIGDIADADLKPPENVLFICKLNPVTEAEDLEIIFSRFGECKADIIVDKETGDSLCYGFIDFTTKKQCERAYFKMDSALIDDRRVKVDFSQSVSKLWNQARRGKAPASNTNRKRRNPAQSSQRPQKRSKEDEGDELVQ